MNTTQQPTTLNGKRVENYRIIRLLGHGGSAHVYLGQHIRFNAYVAIKVLSTPSTDAALIQLWNEARVLQLLKHPHIIRIHDFVADDIITYLVLDYAPYGTLRHRHPPGTRVPLPTIVGYVKQVATALQYIHHHGYIHRDIKPENLLLAYNDVLWLSDFGIATTERYAQMEREKFGTAPYTAPEQILGKPCPASDQYSLGIVVYEQLCGHLPFDGNNQEILHQHMVAPPPSLSERVRMLPREVERVVMKALAKKPAQRFHNIEEFALALEWACMQPPASSHVPPPGRRRQIVPDRARQTECGRADVYDANICNVATPQTQDCASQNNLSVPQRPDYIV